MKIIITESQHNNLKLQNALEKLLNLLYNGFDEPGGLYYDWADFNCDLGVCCDPYAIGFTLLSAAYHDDYLFKYVDSKNYDEIGNYPASVSDDLPEPCEKKPNLENPDFDTIVLYFHNVYEIEKFLGPYENWENSLMSLFNSKFGLNAKKIWIQ